MFSADVNARLEGPVLRRECHWLFPEEMFAAPAPPLRYYPLLPVDISQIPGENLLAVLHQLFAQGNLATVSTVGGI